jgi:MFS transporter, MHS family, shikimate and dehydroshikimate transport protein
VVFGHLGDRVGRKNQLVLTLLITGAATFLIGLLPSYRRWGHWAWISLTALRITQGKARQDPGGGEGRSADLYAYCILV